MGRAEILSFNNVAELKHAVAEKFSTPIHFHDGCGGQYFTVENSSEELRNFIVEYFEKRNLFVVFSDDRSQFCIEKK